MKIYCFLKALLFILATSASAAYSMGAKKPVTPAAPPARSLKRTVSLGKIEVPAVVAGSGQAVLDYSLNRQFDSIVQASGGFSTLVSQIALQPGLEVEARCAAQMPQAMLQGALLGIDLTSTTGISFGYSAGGGLGGVGGDVSLDVKNIEISAMAEALSWDQNLILASSTADKTKSDVTISAGVSYEQMTLNFKNYSESPLAKTITKAMVTALKGISAKLAKTPWRSHVIIADGNFISMNAGSGEGIKVGDEFLVSYNTHYYWQGLPCASALLGEREDTTPVASMKVYEVENGQSWAQVEEFKSADSVVPGATVEILKLAP